MLFLQPTIFPVTISCHTTLSFLLRNCFALIWLGLFRPAIYSSPNGPARPLVLLLHHQWAPMSHLFSLKRPGPVCFLWASSTLFLILHHHGLLLNSFCFPSPITLFLILEVYGLAINPLLSLLSLLWACRGLLSLFHIIYCQWFAFSLFLGSFKPIYLLKAHLFISWACIHYSCRLGLMGFFFSVRQLFSVRIVGLIPSTWASEMAINNLQSQNVGILNNMNKRC